MRSKGVFSDNQIADLHADSDSAKPDHPQQSVRELWRAVASGLSAMDGKPDLLSADFQSKLKYDSRQNRIAGRLRCILPENQDGFFRDHQLAIIMEIIRSVDDVRMFARHCRNAASGLGA